MGNTPTARAVNPSIHGRRFGLDTDDTIIVRGEPDNVSFSIGPGASSNICNVTIQLVDNEGKNWAPTGDADPGQSKLGYQYELDIWLSDSAAGSGLTGTTPSGGIAAASGGGNVLGTLTSSKAIRAQCNTNGQFILAITDSAKTGFYVAAQGFRRGLGPAVSAQLVTANYHS